MVGPRLTLAILVVLSALSQVDRGVISLVVGPISKHFGVNDFQISLLQGISFALFYAIFGLPFGAIADRWSRRWLILGGVVVWSIAATAAGFAATFNQLMFARFLLGAGEAALYPAALSLISDIFPRHKIAGAVATFSMGSSLGAGFSISLGGYLLEYLGRTTIPLPGLDRLEPWQELFVLLGAPGILLGLLIMLAPEPRASGSRAAVATWGELFRFMATRRGFFLRHFGGFTLLGILANCGGWVPVLLMRKFDFSASHAGLAFGLIAAFTNVIGMLAAGAIIGRQMAKGQTDAAMRIFLYSTPVTVGLTVIGCLSGVPAVYIACIAIAQFGFSLVGPSATAIQLVTPPDMRGRISALFVMVFNLVGIGAGPTSIAVFTEFVFRDPQAVNLSFVAVYLILAPLAWLLLLTGLRPMREAMALAEAGPASIGGERKIA